MLITVNGQHEQVGDETSITQLLAQHRLSADKVAVEVNRRLVKSADYGRVLREGDVLEIVTFVGGG